jgi:GTPase SAR1 family protein
MNVFWSMLGYATEDPEKPPAHSSPNIVGVPTDLKKASSSGLGVKYNFKIVIRGARRTGKTALLQRLQAQNLTPEYVPSQAISVATIAWRPQRDDLSDPLIDTSIERCSAGRIKVEVWDVVDRGAPSKVIGTSSDKKLKDAPKGLPTEMPPLDATTVDVYHQCNCAIFMIDIGRRETLAYVLTEGLKVPRHVSILLCANFCDQADRRVISLSEIVEVASSHFQRAVTPFVSSLTFGRQPDEGLSCPVCVIETAMPTNYGLRPLHSYLNIPFTMLRVKCLEERLLREYQALQGHVSELKEITDRQDYATWNTHRAQSMGVAAAAAGRVGLGLSGKQNPNGSPLVSGASPAMDSSPLLKQRQNSESEPTKSRASGRAKTSKHAEGGGGGGGGGAFYDEACPSPVLSGSGSPTDAAPAENLSMAMDPLERDVALMRMEFDPGADEEGAAQYARFLEESAIDANDDAGAGAGGKMKGSPRGSGTEAMVGALPREPQPSSPFGQFGSYQGTTNVAAMTPYASYANSSNLEPPTSTGMGSNPVWDQSEAVDCSSPIVLLPNGSPASLSPGGNAPAMAIASFSPSSAGDCDENSAPQGPVPVPIAIPSDSTPASSKFAKKKAAEPDAQEAESRQRSRLRAMGGKVGP